MSTGRKLKKALGIKKGDVTAPMKKLTEADVRPGEWKQAIIPAEPDSAVNKHRQVPTLIDDQILEDIANGNTAADIERKLSVSRGYVRRVLIRRFGSIEGMKKALQAQCLENALALNEYAIERIDQIQPSQALIGAKIMIDGALALEKNRVDRPTTVDFAALAQLGQSLDRIEKVVSGTDRTIAVSPPQ